VSDSSKRPTGYAELALEEERLIKEGTDPMLMSDVADASGGVTLEARLGVVV